MRRRGLGQDGGGPGTTRARRHASRTFCNGVAVPALVAWPSRMEFDPHVRETSPSPAPPGFDPHVTGPNAAGAVWGSDRPIPESKTRPSIGSSWNQRRVFLRVFMAILWGFGVS